MRVFLVFKAVRPFHTIERVNELSLTNYKSNILMIFKYLILTRHFNREFINLGFSANAQLDYEIAEIIGDKASSLIILDFMANVDSKLIESKLDSFYTIIRRKAPETPILIVEKTIFPQTELDTKFRDVVDKTNATLNEVYHTLISRGEKNVYLVSSLGMIGQDNEGTVDGVHFTDLGFMRYAEYLSPYIRKYLKIDKSSTNVGH